MAPLLQALGEAAESLPLRDAVAACEARFREMAGRVDLGVHTRLRQDARRDIDDRTGIARLQQELAALDLPLPELLTVMVERTETLAGADGSSLELLEDDGSLVCRAGAGLMAPFIGRHSNLEVSLAGRTLREGRVMICDDTEVDGRVDRDAARQIGVRSLIVVPLRSGERLVGVLNALYARPHAFYERDVGNLQILGETLGVTIDKHQVSEKLRASESQYRMLFDRNPQAMFVAELGTLRILAANIAAVTQYGYAESELLDMTMLQLLADGTVDDTARLVASDAPLPRLVDVQRRHKRKDGTVFDVEASVTTIEFGRRTARLVRCSDVTQRLRAERELARVSRAQRLLGACNEALVRAISEEALLQEVCRMTVDIGGYSMVWVGYARNDEGRTVVPVASVGDSTNYLDRITLSWSDGRQEGRGFVGHTVRTGEMVICEDLRSDPRAARWRDDVIALGYRGIVCLPLREGSCTFGLFYLYMGESAPVSPDETRLLEALANDLAFGIVNLRAREDQLRTQEAQQRIQTAMQKVAAAVSASHGTEFFEQMAHNMADALDAQAGFIAVFQPGTDAVFRTLGAVVHGNVVRNFEAPLRGRSKDHLQRSQDWIVTDGVAEEFAPFPLLHAIGACAYAGRRLEDAAGQTIGFVLVCFSGTLRQRDFLGSTLGIFAVRAAAELDRQKSDGRIRHQASLLDKAQDAIIEVDNADRVLYWNKSAERLYGFTAEEALGRPLPVAQADDDGVGERARAQLAASGEWSGEIVRQRKQGATVLVESRWTQVRDELGQPLSVLMLDNDITQRKAAEAEIHKLAFTDPLTGLPNRQLLQDRLHKALAVCHRGGSSGALLCIDLDNFKTLNDTLGHDKGDMLLQHVAMRLVSSVREVDTVARLGGDEFVVVLADLPGVAEDAAVQVRRIGEKILASLGQPYRLEGYEHQSTASMGVARFGPGTESVGELLKHADIAMYQAKAAGRNTLRFFDPGLQAAVTARAALEGDLRQAFIQREFFLQYQPQMEGLPRPDGEAPLVRITGVEALVRWRHPTRGMVSPAQFIPLAEETGLILMLGHRVMEIACTLLASWRDRPGLSDLTMAVNVSARQFRHADFVRQVRAVLEQTGADPARLKLELTESVLVDDMQAIVSKMTALKELGVRFSLDDFGTGYSSLTYLKKLPLDQLKIDQSFVRDVLSDANDAAIARTVIALAQSLGLGVIAEGVETAEQRDFLLRSGCTAFQGYFFSRPLAAEALGQLLATRGPMSPVD